MGSASLRRTSQLVARRPDLQIVNFRGNIQSRVRKLQEKVVDCTLLAMAGLNRMEMTQHVNATLSIEDMLPAVAQGAIGAQYPSQLKKRICKHRLAPVFRRAAVLPTPTAAAPARNGTLRGP